jgi:hypothetical protein
MMNKRRFHFLFALLLSTIAFALVSCNSDDDSFPSGGSVTNVDLSVDAANFTGTCPHDFKFSGLIATNGAGLITYVWERTTGNSNPINVDLPVPGGVVVFDTVTVTASGSFTETLHVTRPNDISSNSVSVTATCQ